jgi:uncharacterized protein (DUF2141 family)
MTAFRPSLVRTLYVAIALAGAGLPLTILAPHASAQTSGLSVTVTDIRNPQGRMMIAVFDQAGYEADGAAVANAAVDVAGDTVSATFPDLKPGAYGIKMFHDVNGDGKMNANPFGIPTEPYAFSNNAKGSMGPARWKDAAFDLPAGGAKQSIKLN